MQLREATQTRTGADRAAEAGRASAVRQNRRSLSALAGRRNAISPIADVGQILQLEALPAAAPSEQAPAEKADALHRD
jgi:hypothetical protein